MGTIIKIHTHMARTNIQHLERNIIKHHPHTIDISHDKTFAVYKFDVFHEVALEIKTQLTVYLIP